MGIDFGTKRVGLAISDGLGLTSRGLAVVPRSEVIGYLRELATEYEFDTVVVGLPTGLSGGEGESAKGARTLAAQLHAELGLHVEYVDERFTSRMAEEGLLKAGMSRTERRRTVDKVAASLILQSFLDRQGASGNSTSLDDVEPTDTQ